MAAWHHPERQQQQQHLGASHSCVLKRKAEELGGGALMGGPADKRPALALSSPRHA